MTDTLLRVENLTTWLGDEQRPVRVVDGIDVEIRRGETFALLGESGCGKSMTALSLMRLLPPSGRIVDGSVRLGDQDLVRLSEREMRGVRGGRMAMIFQEPMTSLNPVLTVGDQIAESVRVHDRLRGPAVRQRVVELLESVGIPGPAQRAGEYPHQLSGGMKQRVMIAIALAGRPDLLIADEPTTALDVTIQAQVLALLKDIQRETGMAVLLITHDLGVVAETAGRLVEQASCGQFFGGARHPYSIKLFESLPGADKRAQPLAVIRGSVPTLDQPFSGCRFVDRCDAAMDICRSREPEWEAHGGESFLRCYLATLDSGAALGASAPAERCDEQPAAEGKALLRVEGLKVHFPIHRGVLRRVVGHVRAVDGVSLEIPAGRTLALVGESGCGKTTVGKAILQLIRPTAGDVAFDDVDLTRLKGRALRSRRSDFQIIFQDPVSSMNPRMLVGDIVAEGMLAQGIGGSQGARRARVEELLGQVGMPATAAGRYPHEFSGGQRQRICIARALAVNPRLIVCDEPTSALDVSVQAQVLNLLKDLQREMGLAYLFITHDLSVVSYLAHEVAVMYLGRVVERGTAEEVLDSPLHPYTRALLSAVPVPDPGRKSSIIHLEGDMPSPANPPEGCHFHPRCNQALAECRASYPPAVTLSSTRSVSCHLEKT